MLQMSVRFTGAPSPRVRAAAESSSPIFTMEIIKGISRYSSIFPGCFPPKRMPRIRMASRMTAFSSPMVGKNRKITDSGMTIFSERCIRFMAARKSLTEVEAMRKAPIMIPGANRVIMEHTARSRKDGSPVSRCSAARSRAKHAP